MFLGERKKDNSYHLPPLSTLSKNRKFESFLQEQELIFYSNIAVNFFSGKKGEGVYWNIWLNFLLPYVFLLGNEGKRWRGTVGKKKQQYNPRYVVKASLSSPFSLFFICGFKSAKLTFFPSRLKKKQEKRIKFGRAI